MSDLFGDSLQAPSRTPENAPLADKLRPAKLAEIIGQEHLTGPEGAIGRMVAAGKLSSMILWGPPGTGKTSIARLLADAVDMHYKPISAVFSGVADLKKAFAEAEKMARTGKQTLLFVDEIHRFNRAQQDGFLPVVEDGTVTLVGATTENPSFALNGALLSRCQVLVLKRLDDAALELLLTRAEALMGRALPLAPEARAVLRAMADGDGRYGLNMAEQLFALPEGSAPLDPAGLSSLLAKRAALYDKDREEHYNLISALHKSMRGSDPDAALYWFARMLTGGEDPRYIARRLTRFAAEDIGMADPRALPLAIAAWETFERMGSPEGELALAECVVYLAIAPKSNAVYKAYNSVRKLIKADGTRPVPLHLRNAPTALMKDLDYGKAYRYAHDEPDAFAAGESYWPEGMTPPTLYEPVERGLEIKIAEKMRALREKNTKASKP